jgi:hypothetical protein
MQIGKLVEKAALPQMMKKNNDSGQTVLLLRSARFYLSVSNFYRYHQISFSNPKVVIS